MHKEVIAFVNDALRAGRTVALAILSESGRDTPGVPGAMLAICADGSRVGTVGGGPLEARIISDCLEALESTDVVTRSFNHSLGGEGEIGMICGGEVAGMITVMRPEKRLIVFGGGHVGRKTCEAGLVAGFSVTVVDDRPEYAAPLPGVNVVVAADFAAAAREMTVTGDCYAVVVTRGHAQDYAVLSALVESDCAYLGMIGSSKKVAGLFKTLRESGVREDALAKVYTPIGVDIDDGTPGEIAIAILAEILAVKNRDSALRHCRDVKRGFSNE